ncbi:MAG TPA: SAM-dependent methyltransferase [Streptosporangiaceae bacterium]|nr:SAM-dependent methyltransferase [Streptosporangiaceae bacterium]
MTETQRVPPGIDPDTPSPARLYDYYLGGVDNFPADRAAAEKIRARMPELADAAWANRGFHQRAARWLADVCGIRQFIDIGSGLPTQNNTHQAVQKVAPDARVVYVDNDPLVRVHASALLTGEGSTGFITADLRDPDSVLNHPHTRELIDFGQPAGLLMTAVLHFVADGSDPCGLVRRYMAELPPGSYLALTHITADQKPPAAVQAILDIYAKATEQMHMRTRAEVERFFDGLELVPPYEGAPAAVTYVGEWGAEDADLADSDGSRWCYGAVARRP